MVAFFTFFRSLFPVHKRFFLCAKLLVYIDEHMAVPLFWSRKPVIRPRPMQQNGKYAEMFRLQAEKYR